MKKITKAFVLGFLILMISTQSQAQIYVGVHAGIHNAKSNIQGINSSLLPELGSVPSLTGGISVEVPLDRYLSVSTGVDYKQRGFDLHIGTDFDVAGINIPVGVRATSRLNYIDVPLHLKYSVGNSKYKGFIKAGPSLSYGLNGSIRSFASTIIDIPLTNTDIDFADEAFSRTNVQGDIAIGGELQYGLGKLTAELGYSKGFGRFLSENSFIDADLKYSGVTMKLGYAIAF